jgi:uncharacterized protein YyaL (SSP411 family)
MRYTQSVALEWREWSEEVFAEARLRERPVLLFLRASWCRWCNELERDVLSDPRVAELIQRQFIGVRVDKDRRPDLDARYSKGGWPTLAYLDDSGELIANDAYLEADALAARLNLVAGYYAENRDSIRRRLAEAAEGDWRPAPAAPAGARAKEELSDRLVEWVTATLLENADPTSGGWGTQHKFPHPEAIDFALARWSETGDEGLRKLVLRTLRHMQQGEIHDRVEGGFYRYAANPDWSEPHCEKLLDSNAQRLRAYLEAYQALGEDSFADTAEGILRWMLGTMLDLETGAFRGSQDADPSYARLDTLAARRKAQAPACDPTIFANWNAMAVSALLKAAVVLQRPELSQRALATLAFLEGELFDSRRGMHHYWDGTYHLPGLLSDQAYMLRALIDAAQFAGESRYVERAEELAGLALANLKSPLGGFWDTAHDPGARGGLRRRNRSILENAAMAEALLRLSHLTRDPSWAAVARETLESFLTDYKRFGHFVAGYARAADLYLHPPVHVTIVGPKDREDTWALRQAALAPYFSSRIVETVDPRQQAAFLERIGLPAGGEGPARAYVHRGRESYAETTDPGRLSPLMTRIERGV